MKKDVMEEIVRMPSTILSHQGIVLPIKIKYPTKFDGTALIVGSFVPDIPILLSILLGYRVEIYFLFHSIGGLIYTGPLSILLVILIDRFITPIIGYMALEIKIRPISYLMTFFSFDDLSKVTRKKVSLFWIIKAIFSVLIGIFSHFLLDLPTHGYIPYFRPFISSIMPSWFLIEHFSLWLPFYGFIKMTNYNILWILFSMLFGLLALISLLHIKKNKLISKWHNSD